MVAKYTSEDTSFQNFEKSLRKKKTFSSKWLEGKSFRAIGKELNMSQTAVMNNFWREISSYEGYSEVVQHIDRLFKNYENLDFSSRKYGNLFSLIAKRELGAFTVGKNFSSRQKKKVIPLLSSLQEEILSSGLPYYFKYNTGIGFNGDMGFLNHGEAGVRYIIQHRDGNPCVSSVIPRKMKKRKQA